MTRTLFIHTGPAKTGTSAVQHLLRDLDDPKLVYPKTGQWPDGSHNMLYFAIQGQRRWGNIEIPPLAELADQMSAELMTAPHNVLISSESFETPDRLRLLRRLLANAIARFDRVVPIVTLRHPVERASSTYNQAVKEPAQGLQMWPDPYLFRTIKSHSLSQLVTAWQSFSADTLFLPHHPREDFVQRFVSALGRPDLAPKTNTIRNRSMGGLGLALLLISNRIHKTREERADFFRNTLRGNKDLKLWQSASFPFSEAAVEQVTERFVRQDLELCQARTGMDLSNWSAPQPIALTRRECEQIRAVCDREFPTIPEQAKITSAVLNLFATGKNFATT